MQTSLRERLLETLPVLRVVGEQHLVIVVRAQGVAVNAVGHIEIIAALLRSEPGREGHAVDARTAEPVLDRPSAVLRRCEIVVDGLLDIDRGHHTILFGIHVRTRDAIHVENGDVESRPVLFVFRRHLPGVERPADALADRIVLVFQRAVNAAVGWIHRQAAQMARHAVHAAYQIAFEVHLQQFGREGEIDVAAFEIDGNALHVERTLFARADFARQVTQIGTVFRPVGARRAGRQQQRNDQQREQTFEVHRKFFLR